MFTLGIGNYRKGMVRKTDIFMGVVEKFSMKSPLHTILGQYHYTASLCCIHWVHEIYNIIQFIGKLIISKVASAVLYLS